MNGQAPEAELLRDAARRQRLSAPDLAAKIEGVGVDTVRNWLKGYRTVSAGEIKPSQPDRYQLADLARLLNLSAQDLRAVGRDDAAAEIETVAPADQTADRDIRYRKPAGMGDDKWDQIHAKTDGYVQRLLDEAAEER